MNQTLRVAAVPLVTAMLLSVVTASAAEQANPVPKTSSPGPHRSVKELQDEFPESVTPSRPHNAFRP
jgi:hypothetical protein